MRDKMRHGDLTILLAPAHQISSSLTMVIPVTSVRHSHSGLLQTKKHCGTCFRFANSSYDSDAFNPSQTRFPVCQTHCRHAPLNAGEINSRGYYRSVIAVGSSPEA